MASRFSGHHVIPGLYQGSNVWGKTHKTAWLVAKRTGPGLYDCAKHEIWARMADSVFCLECKCTAFTFYSFYPNCQGDTLISDPIFLLTVIHFLRQYTPFNTCLHLPHHHDNTTGYVSIFHVPSWLLAKHGYIKTGPWPGFVSLEIDFWIGPW